MAYDEKLANRIREHFAQLDNVREKEMMGGLTIMYNEKMCVGIFRGDLMCRIDPAMQEEVLEREGCTLMEMGGKAINGYILANEIATKNKKDFNYLINLAIEFNKHAKASKKRK